MNYKLFVRKFHRYLALIIAIQLLFWSVGGFYFSINSIDEIHGDHLVTRNYMSPRPACSVGKAVDAIQQEFADDINQLASVAGPFNWFWKISTSAQEEYRDWCTGQPVKLISDTEIRQIAKKFAPHAGRISSANWLTGVESDSEFRGKPLPAWQVIFEGDENLHLYLDGHTGIVITARTDRWRIFDFLWMLHVMDYETRDDFNHLLLQVFALMAVVTSMSGILLWWSSRRRRVR